VQNRQLWEEHELLKKELLQKKALSSLNVTEKASNMIKPGQITYTTGHTALAHNTE
jgi:hypothetical protein